MDGILCKHCGQQETPHLCPDSLADITRPDIPKEGCSVSILDCPGYAPESAEPSRSEEENQNFILGCERRAAERGGWALYGVYARKRQVEDGDVTIDSPKTEVPWLVIC